MKKKIAHLINTVNSKQFISKHVMQKKLNFFRIKERNISRKLSMQCAASISANFFPPAAFICSN